LRLGQRVELAEAGRRAGFAIALPRLPELGAPDEVYLDSAATELVWLVYRARGDRPAAGVGAASGVAYLLMQLRQGQGLEEGILLKTLGPDSRLEALTINGRRAFWIEGQPHRLFFLLAGDRFQQDEVRLVGNVLLWQRGEITYRLEGAASRAEALRIAASLGEAGGG
jgi:hypothetical protein